LFFVSSVRVRAGLAGLLGAGLAWSAAAMPAAASPRTIDFTITADPSVTTFVVCPSGTPTNVMECGNGVNEPATASNDEGDPGLTGGVTASFISAVEFPTSTPYCAMQLKDASNVTIKTTRGDISLVSHGAFCASTNLDLETFTIVGGTGRYAGATGSGVVTAQSKGQTLTQAISSDTYTGTITLAR
jgi:hypothetical protein